MMHLRQWFLAAVFWVRTAIVRRKPSAVRRKINPNRGDDTEERGSWYFRRDILDRLDKYREYAKKVRKVDKDAYRHVCQIGAVVTSGRAVVQAAEMSASWRAGKRIGFGAVALMERPSEEMIPARFVYFTRVDRLPWTVEHPNEPATFYRMCIVYHDSHLGTGAASFHLSVDDSVNVRVLRQSETMTQRIRSKNKRKGLPKDTYVQRLRFGYPSCLDGIGVDEKTGEDHYKGLTIHQKVARLLTMCSNIYEDASKDVLVRAKKSGVTAAFTIDMLRTPYFFRDRDTVLTSTGHRKRIFHIVRTHARNTKRGTSYVRSHFRGARKFMWNSYDVTVSMPGKHHIDMLDVDVGALDYTDEDVPIDTITHGQFVDGVEQHLGA